MATRAASIWRSVIHAHSIAFSPNSPKEIEDPRHALPAMRPRCCFLNLTFFGIIMAVSPQSLLVLARAFGLRLFRLARFRCRLGLGGGRLLPRFLLPRRRLLRRHQRRHNRRRRTT